LVLVRTKHNQRPGNHSVSVTLLSWGLSININMQQQHMLQLFKTQCNCPLPFEPKAWRKMSVWWTLVDGLVPVA
jgi:hypothetical protein